MTVVTESLLRSALTHDFNVHHLDISDHRDISNVERIDVRNVYLAFRHGAAFIFALLRFRADIVHIQVARNRVGFLRDALFLLPSRLARRTTVLHLNSRDFAEFYEREPWWMRLLIRVAISPNFYAAVLSSRFRDTFGDLIRPNHVFVIPNGTPDMGAGHDAESRSPVVLHLSTMWRLKGTFDVIEAARYVSKAVPDVKFVLAGGWFSDDERLEALEAVKSYQLDSVIEFCGPIFGAKKTELFRRAAVFTLPTRYPTEGQPIAVLEALSSGTPVVASDLAAIPDMVRDGREGYLVPVDDLERLSARLVDVLTDLELRGRMGRAARRRYETEYTMGAFAERIRALWLGALDDRARLSGSSGGAPEQSTGGVVGAARDMGSRG